MKGDKFRLTEQDVASIIGYMVEGVLKEDVLGDNFRQREESEVLNNYEPFDDQKDDQDHDAGIVGDQSLDPTVYNPNQGLPIGEGKFSLKLAEGDFHKLIKEMVGKNFKKKLGDFQYALGECAPYLTDENLHRLFVEAVQQIQVNEVGDTDKGQFKLGRLQARKSLNKDVDGAAEVSKYAKAQREKQPEKDQNYLNMAHSTGYSSGVFG